MNTACDCLRMIGEWLGETATEDDVALVYNYARSHDMIVWDDFSGLTFVENFDAIEAFYRAHH